MQQVSNPVKSQQSAPVEQKQQLRKEVVQEAHLDSYNQPTMEQQLCHTSDILAVAAGRGGNGLRYWRIKTKGPSVCETIFGGCPVLSADYPQSPVKFHLCSGCTKR